MINHPPKPIDIEATEPAKELHIMAIPLLPHGTAPQKVWIIWPHDGGAPVLWTTPCPFPVDDGTVVEYQLPPAKKVRRPSPAQEG